MNSKRPFRAARQAGFTLVELVVVITILGILAAVAMPRFANLQKEARIAKVEALAGSMRSAAGQVKAMAIVKAVDCSADIAKAASTVSLEGTAIQLEKCYPAASADGIVVAAGLDAARDGVTFDHATVAGTTRVQVSGATCMATYTRPAGADQPVTVSAVVSGC